MARGLRGRLGPHLENVVVGQLNLIDAYTRSIDFTDPASGKSYALRPDEELAVVVRPRGWHLNERHSPVDGSSTGAFVDFGLYFFHNARRLLDLARAPTSTSRRRSPIWRPASGTTSRLRQDHLGSAGTVRATS